MSRITGSDAFKMFEAYAAVYPLEEQIELTEEQVWEEVETWVNSLLEEGYDLSDYTWEEMYEAYLSELSGNLIGDIQSAWKNRGKIKSGAERVGTGASKSLSDAGAGINKAATSTLKPIAKAATSNTAKAAAAGFTSGGLIGAIQGALGSRTAQKPSTPPPTAPRPTATAPTAPRPTATAPTAPRPTATAPTAPRPTATAPTAPRPTTTAPTGGKGKVAPAPAKPAAAAQTGDKAKDMATWAKANPKLAAAAAERARTRGTSATTNPLMKDMKSRLPAPAATPTPSPARSGFGVSSTPIAAKASVSTATAPEVKATNTIAAAPKLAPVSPRQARLKMEMEYDAYDLVLEYLLSQGHVDTVEEAHYVMLEMDAETIGMIVEGSGVVTGAAKVINTVMKPVNQTPEQEKKAVGSITKGLNVVAKPVKDFLSAGPKTNQQMIDKRRP